tara:strand:+ start:218 stop:436 length:219 start_codon:yes stop_codon:yes gene_type:complete
MSSLQHKKKAYNSLQTIVKGSFLLYKNPFHVFFKVSVKIDKSGSKIDFKLKSVSYTLENQLHKIIFKLLFQI